ncbi:shikimate dehydrogenase [soil metagenome]
MTISAGTRLAAVIGSPIRHSLSPVIHNAAFAATGAGWVFVALEVAPGAGAAAVDAMRVLGIDGLAVTTPHKEAVAGAVDDVDPAAAALGSVNTVVLRDGVTHGYSTDGAGFVESLRAAGHDPSGAHVAVVGAGAATRSVIDAIDRAGVGRIVVINRSADTAARAAALSTLASVADPASIALADLVVNATSVGMGTDEAPFDVTLLHRHQVVADLVYHPLDTALLRAAAEVGAATVDGLGMLVHQAVLQQHLWTGHRPDPTPLRHTALTELSARIGATEPISADSS